MSNSSSYPAAAGGASVSESKKDRNIRVMLERLAKIEHDFSDSKQEYDLICVYISIHYTIAGSTGPR